MGVAAHMTGLTARTDADVAGMDGNRWQSVDRNSAFRPSSSILPVLSVDFVDIRFVRFKEGLGSCNARVLRHKRQYVTAPPAPNLINILINAQRNQSSTKIPQGPDSIRLVVHGYP